MLHPRAARLFFAILLVLGLGAAPASAERVELVTQDGYGLVGDLWPGAADAPAVILLHMYKSDRSAWAPLVPKLQAAGYTVLAIDQRAHGESTRRNRGSFRVTDIPRHEFGKVVRRGVYDVAEARSLLRARGLGGGGLALVGASYGCSVSLLSTQFAPGIGAVVLLSPGISYFGVDVLEAARAFPGALLGVAAEDDRNVAAGTAAIVEAHPGQDELVVYPTGGHGTRLFAPRPEVLTAVVDFLGKALRR